MLWKYDRITVAPLIHSDWESWDEHTKRESNKLNDFLDFEIALNNLIPLNEAFKI